MNSNLKIFSAFIIASFVRVSENSSFTWPSISCIDYEAAFNLCRFRSNQLRKRCLCHSIRFCTSVSTPIPCLNFLFNPSNALLICYQFEQIFFRISVSRRASRFEKRMNLCCGILVTNTWPDIAQRLTNSICSLEMSIDRFQGSIIAKCSVG